MDRREHFEQSLAHNLEMTAPFGAQVEFVLVDYNSSDGFGEWLIEAYPEALAACRIRYFRTTEPREYVHAHAKNISHRMARGSLVCNLDGDDLLDAGAVHRFERLFATNPRSIVREGGGGRICLSRRDFLHVLGGYDEAFRYWGLEDDDLVARATAAGLSLRNLRHRGKKIAHSETLRFANLAAAPGGSAVAGLPTALQLKARMLAQQDPRKLQAFLGNSSRFMENRRRGRVRVAPAAEIGRAALVDHRGEVIRVA